MTQSRVDSSWTWPASNDEEDGIHYVYDTGTPPAGELLDELDEERLLLPNDLNSSSSNRSRMGDTELLSDTKPSHLPQYLTALAATMGALSMGTIMGYSSPASVQLAGGNATACDNHTDADYSVSDCKLIGGAGLTDAELSWFSSSVNLGALLGVPVTGLLLNFIGRQKTMVLSIVPFLLGWILIGTATDFGMLVSGRVITGFCAGLTSLAVPTYLGEIASADIRGLLGTCFQLMVTVGILYTYTIGAGVCWQWLALSCLLPAVLFAVGMFFSKESPSYLLFKNKSEQARKSLTFFRGKNYNVEQELTILHQSILEAQEKKGSFKDLLLPHNMKPLIISLSLMIFQQFSGINAILFNLTKIFESANSSLSSNASSIIIAAVQVVATVFASGLMDKAGRKLLLLVSSAAMVVSLVMMGTFFYLKEQNGDDAVSSLGWLPLLSLVIFIGFFSIGFGPVPWVLMGELFSADVRELAGSLAAMSNWLFSFIVTLVFVPLQKAINDSGVYWLFASMCVVNFIFTLLVVKETKGKTVQEISAMFGGPSGQNKNSSRSMIGHTNHI